MKIDMVRLKKYLADITNSSRDLNNIVDQKKLQPESIELKAVKYILIELAEAMSNTLQHILAKQMGIAVSGYIDTIAKGYKEGVISDDLFNKLKPFFDFRNSLVHRYWVIDDKKLIANILNGKNDFEQFVDEIDIFIKSLK
jgi:uncharacterized protein YutE (UPF0331/DUF86 family)